MLPVRSQPDSFVTSLSMSNSVQYIITADSATSTARAIYCSNYKPKRSKCFHFSVFLLLNIRGGLSTKLDELQQIMETYVSVPGLSITSKTA